MSLFYIAVLGLLMQAIRSFRIGEPPGTAGTSLALGYVLLTAFFAGRVASSLRLPKLTGYLAAGVLVGPHGLGLVGSGMVDQLGIVNGMAVALIALTAGTELDMVGLRPLFRTILWTTVFAVFGTQLILGVAFFAGRSVFPFLAELAFLPAVAMCLLLGIVVSASSPAVVVALRDELEADGPVSRTVLGVVVFSDLLVILAFALVATIARVLVGEGTGEAVGLGLVAWELAGSLLIGAALGATIAVYLSRVRAGSALFVLMVTFVMAEVGARLHLDALLLALGAGVFVRNATRFGEELQRQITAGSLPVSIVFFAVAGAGLHLDVLPVVAVPALVLVAIRAASALTGARLAARMTKAPETVRRWAGFGLLPQAGLALALSLLLARSFPELGEHAAALTLGIVAINELFAPIAYRFALARAGEIGKRAPAEPAAPEPAPVATTA